MPIKARAEKADAPRQGAPDALERLHAVTLVGLRLVHGRADAVAVAKRRNGRITGWCLLGGATRSSYARCPGGRDTGGRNNGRSLSLASGALRVSTVTVRF